MPQVDPKEAHTAALKREVQLLRAENAYLRGQLSGDATTGNPTGLQTGQADGGLARASMMPTSKRPPAEVILPQRQIALLQGCAILRPYLQFPLFVS